MTKRLRAMWEASQVDISCAWCFAHMLFLTLAEAKATGMNELRCPECNGINVLPSDLLAAARHKTPAIDPDNPPGRALAFDGIIGNIVLKRALEVALVGRHTLAYIGDVSVAWNQVSIVLGPRAVQITRCPCGHYLSPEMKECTCTLEEIELWCKTKQYQEALASDIQIEVFNPKPDEHFAWREPYTDVYRRIRYTRELQAFQRATFKRNGILERQTVDFLYVVKERLNLTATQLQSMCRVAMTIADMEHVEQVGIGHAAEAAQYKSPLFLNH